VQIKATINEPSRRTSPNIGSMSIKHNTTQSTIFSIIICLRCHKNPVNEADKSSFFTFAIPLLTSGC